MMEKYRSKLLYHLSLPLINDISHSQRLLARLIKPRYNSISENPARSPKIVEKEREKERNAFGREYKSPFHVQQQHARVILGKIRV